MHDDMAKFGASVLKQIEGLGQVFGQNRKVGEKGKGFSPQSFPPSSSGSAPVNC